MEIYLPEHSSLIVLFSGIESHRLSSRKVPLPGLPLPTSIWAIEHEFNLYKLVRRIQNLTCFLNSTEEMPAIFWGVSSSVSWSKESLRLSVATRSLKFFKKNPWDGQRLPVGEPISGGGD